MNDFISAAEIRWSDLDPNLHLRHSVYYDFGAFARIDFFTRNGITSEVMLQHNIGPILFREECVFKKKFVLAIKLLLTLNWIMLTGTTHDGELFMKFFKNNDLVAALITVDGAWLDTEKRKLAIPPDIFKTTFELIPKTNNFMMF